MQHACDAGSYHLLMHSEHPYVPLAGVPCNLHATQILNTAWRTSSRGLCFAPEGYAVRM